MLQRDEMPPEAGAGPVEFRHLIRQPLGVPAGPFRVEERNDPAAAGFDVFRRRRHRLVEDLRRQVVVARNDDDRDRNRPQHIAEFSEAGDGGVIRRGRRVDQISRDDDRIGPAFHLEELQEPLQEQRPICAFAPRMLEIRPAGVVDIGGDCEPDAHDSVPLNGFFLPSESTAT